MNQATKVVSIKEGIPLEEAQSRLLTELGLTSDEVALPRFNARVQEHAVAVIRNAPIAFLDVAAHGVVLILAGPGVRTLSDYFGRRVGSWLIGYSCLYLGLLYLGCIAAIPLTYRNRQYRGPAVLLVLLIAYFIVVASGEGYARFRIPLIPLLSVFAAPGLEILGARFRKSALGRKIESPLRCEVDCER